MANKTPAVKQWVLAHPRFQASTALSKPWSRADIRDWLTEVSVHAVSGTTSCCGGGCSCPRSGHTMPDCGRRQGYRQRSALEKWRLALDLRRASRGGVPCRPWW
ncbi:Hypothetical Protein sle_61480 [Streptomyces leeuwenhoekii]|uniref:Uncharacterized protein n=1 Tax=Streptomyces leeuwenhoekii TaxID=1437453 RepID=A0A0F7W4D8_STRLW|nr:Hypothetical Protein sle_61480 [Streptomyces leeuwenhoekii]